MNNNETKNDPKQMTRHHRKSRFLGGTSQEKNISLVTREKHEAWHMNFPGHMDPFDIARVINDTFLDPDFVLVPIRKTVQ